MPQIAHFSTLAEMLMQRIASTPFAIPYHFEVSEGKEDSLSYSDLDASAGRVAEYLRVHCDPDMPVLLVFQPGLEFIKAFWGCIFAGIIAVPVPCPSHRDTRLLTILKDSGSGTILTTPMLVRTIQDELASRYVSKTLIVSMDQILEQRSAGTSPEPERRQDGIAYLQYTSGSTATPRGVIVTHGNVLSNMCDIDEAFQHRVGDISVSWLPHFHDMGLVYGVLQPIFNEMAVHLSSPSSFIQNPMRWLRTISWLKATHSGAPNFAYDLCVRRMERRELNDLDLRCWRVAFCGAEPVRADTLVRFAAAFSECGFHREAFFPAYGLAEATLKVTSRAAGAPLAYCSPLLNQELENAGLTSVLPSCGRPGSRTRIEIVDPVRQVKSEAGSLGEIWVSGEGVTPGYWNCEENSSGTYGCFLEGQGPYLRTGDLGFIQDGELYVAGRIKDLIIIRGENFYPHDLEMTVLEAGVGRRSLQAAAFSVESPGGEELIIVIECRDQDASFLRQRGSDIQAAISQKHGIVPRSILLTSSGTIPKTSSGKIQRSLCRELYLTGALTVLAEISRTFPSQLPHLPDLALLMETLRCAPDRDALVVVERYLLRAVSALTGISFEQIDPANSLVSPAIRANSLLVEFLKGGLGFYESGSVCGSAILKCGVRQPRSRERNHATFPQFHAIQENGSPAIRGSRFSS